MALAVAAAMEGNGVLAVEAGTGVGKSLAYLVPVLLSGRRACISTSTQALQDQLFLRDIPALSRTLNLPLKVALLKGRSSYLCVHRLQLARQTAASARYDPALVSGLEQVQRWAEHTQHGDLAELAALDERSPLRPWISSTSDNCLGASCPSATQCHVNRARCSVAQADWVVINHHVFLADASEASLGPGLPNPEVMVFDEAHALADAACDVLAPSVSQPRVRALAHDLARGGPLWAPGMQAWVLIAMGLERAALQLAQLAPSTRRTSRWPADAPEDVDSRAWALAQTQLTQALLMARRALRASEDGGPGLRSLLARSEGLLQDWLRLTTRGPAPADPNAARWIDWADGDRQRAGWCVQQVPLDDSLARRAVEALHTGADRCWVFTSSTLGNDPDLSWFTRGLGLDRLEQLRTLRVPSPFDHVRQAAICVPGTLPDPGDAGHAVALADSVATWASRLGGRTLVLCSSLRAVARIAAQLRARVEAGQAAPLQVLAQGDASRRALLARFRAAGAADVGAVLVASASFREGVDLAGEVLQLVVIDKLPFPSPDEPLIRAQADRLRALGKSGFELHDLPMAIQALRQGVGRLIRSEDDRGVVVIGDRRLLTRSYGPGMLASLPPMRWLDDEAQLLAELDDLVVTRASTKGRRPA